MKGSKNMVFAGVQADDLEIKETRMRLEKMEKMILDGARKKKAGSFSGEESQSNSEDHYSFSSDIPREENPEKPPEIQPQCRSEAPENVPVLHVMEDEEAVLRESEKRFGFPSHKN